jgi:hypothetical protein
VLLPQLIAAHRTQLCTKHRVVLLLCECVHCRWCPTQMRAASLECQTSIASELFAVAAALPPPVDAAPVPVAAPVKKQDAKGKGRKDSGGDAVSAAPAPVRASPTSLLALAEVGVLHEDLAAETYATLIRELGAVTSMPVSATGDLREMMSSLCVCR